MERHSLASTGARLALVPPATIALAHMTRLVNNLDGAATFQRWSATTMSDPCQGGPTWFRWHTPNHGDGGSPAGASVIHFGTPVPDCSCQLPMITEVRPSSA